MVGVLASRPAGQGRRRRRGARPDAPCLPGAAVRRRRRGGGDRGAGRRLPGAERRAARDPRRLDARQPPGIGRPAGRHGAVSGFHWMVQREDREMAPARQPRVGPRRVLLVVPRDEAVAAEVHRATGARAGVGRPAGPRGTDPPCWPHWLRSTRHRCSCSPAPTGCGWSAHTPTLTSAATGQMESRVATGSRSRSCSIAKSRSGSPATGAATRTETRRPRDRGRERLRRFRLDEDAGPPARVCAW